MAQTGAAAQGQASGPPAVAAARARGRASPSTPKRILTLDAPGARAPVQFGLLAQLEDRLGRRSFFKDFKLSDYFDLIVGTGAGAYVAAELARGRKVAEIEIAFAQIGPDMVFKRDPAALDVGLTGLFGAAPVEGAPWRVGFGAFLKRRSDGLVLFVTDRAAPEPGALVTRVLQAATAAPAKFDSEKVALRPDGTAAPFADATAAGLADPALAVVRALAARQGGYDWTIGPDRTLLVSIGAGRRPQSTGKWSVAEALAQDVAAASQETLLGISEGARRSLETGPRLAHLPMLRYERFDAVLTVEHATALAADPVEAAPALRALGAAAFDAALTPPEGAPERLVFPKAFNPPGFGKRPLGPPKIRLEALGRAFQGRR
ncbi:MAG: hypothetical protein KJS97_11060 [Alphaproteobacteria bacterium]|nr:hypothetical protein [Alphaproteobacteria bacterium]